MHLIFCSPQVTTANATALEGKRLGLAVGDVISMKREDYVFRMTTQRICLRRFSLAWTPKRPLCDMEYIQVLRAVEKELADSGEGLILT